jgi:hypothetical protein
VSRCFEIDNAHDSPTTDDLLRRLCNAHLQAQGYTDDVVLLQKDRVARVFETARRLLNSAR